MPDLLDVVVVAVPIFCEGLFSVLDFFVKATGITVLEWWARLD
jgi:hypothetical protein